LIVELISISKIININSLNVYFDFDTICKQYFKFGGKLMKYTEEFFDNSDNKNFIKEINEFENKIKIKKETLLNKLNPKQSIIVTKEFLSISTSECLLEDVEMSLNLFSELRTPKYSQNARFINLIIRNMCEQAIEYIYIMKNPQLIKEYFNFNIPDDPNEISYYKFVKEANSKRFTSKRKSVYKMANELNEVNNSSDDICLYNIYSDKSELIHNSYFNSIFLLNIDFEEIKSFISLNLMYITYILEAFIKEYDTI